MKRSTAISLLSLAILCSGCWRPSIERLENGLYSMEFRNQTYLIDPDLGGRIVSARYDGKEVLLQERDSLLNWGSTFWPSPQRIWNWPPPGAIHMDPYVPVIIGDTLVLTSEPDSEFGMQVVKKLRFNALKTRLEIEYMLINRSDTVMRVAPWEITCVPAPGSKVLFPLGNMPGGVHNSLPFEEKDNLGWFEFNPENLQSNHKLFINPNEGWAGHVNAENVFFLKTFDIVPLSSLPPGQGNVEIYASKRFEYIEIENHGHYRELQPGECLTYRVNWYMVEIDNEISENAGRLRELVYRLKK